MVCDNALISGFALQRTPVDADVVIEVCRDFDLAAAPSATDADAGGTTPVPVSPAGQAPPDARPVAAPRPAPITPGRLLDIEFAAAQPVAVAEMPSSHAAEPQGPDLEVGRAWGFGRRRWFFS